MAPSLRARLSSVLCNLKSWRTNRKLIVFESDDWGSIRSPEPVACRALEEAGINLSASAYNRVDCLESGHDLNGLLDVLASSRGSNGKPAVFTTYNVMGNPDFKKIRDCDYAEYHFETSFDSYIRYHGEDLRPVWRSAIDDRLLCPQFHAREHLNVPLWLDDLRSGHPETQLCFEHGFFGNQRSNKPPRFYMAAYWARSLEHLAQIKLGIDAGLVCFQSSFGYAPTNFVACDYVLPKPIEAYVSSKNIQGIQTQRGYRAPCPTNLQEQFVYRHTGFVNEWGSVFTVRNGSFEPGLAVHRDPVGHSMAEIQTAFRMRCPAVISTHRANYVSGIEPQNGGSSLLQLRELLQRIRKKWPTAEFLTSAELLELIRRDLNRPERN
jgi:hypothetical protein